MSELATGSKALVAAAEREVLTLSVAEASESLEAGAVFGDLRDVREVRRDGKILGSYHAPRGMLEFWVDPESPYHHETLSSADDLVLYCNLGWRSALAAKTLQDMGLTNVAHLGGGFDACYNEGGAVEEPTK